MAKLSGLGSRKISKRQRRNVAKLERKAVAVILLYVAGIVLAGALIYYFAPDLFDKVGAHRH